MSSYTTFLLCAILHKVMISYQTPDNINSLKIFFRICLPSLAILELFIFRLAVKLAHTRGLMEIGRLVFKLNAYISPSLKPT